MPSYYRLEGNKAQFDTFDDRFRAVQVSQTCSWRAGSCVNGTEDSSSWMGDGDISEEGCCGKRVVLQPVRFVLAATWLWSGYILGYVVKCERVHQVTVQWEFLFCGVCGGVAD